MKTIKLTKTIEHEGLVEGDVISVDEFSAKALIDRQEAEAYEPEEGTAEAEPVRTIDDIVDPEVARNKRVMTATVVGAVDNGPVRRSPDADPAAEPEVVDGDADSLDADTSDVNVKATQKSSKRGGPSTGNSGTKSTGPELAAPAANAAGGDAGGGDGS